MRASSVSVLSAIAVVLLLSVVCPTAFAKPADKNSRVAKYVTLCKTSDPKIDKCMINALNDILKHAKTGIPELGVPAIEPFLIRELDLKIFQALGTQLFGNQQNSDKFRALARNIIVHHSSEFKLHHMKIDMKKKEFFANLTFPFLQIEGEYDVNLMMFNLPIKSTGPVKINATNIFVESTLMGKLVNRKNDKYLMFDNVDIKVNFQDYSVVIENLFKKDQNLNRAVNDMIKTQKHELKKMTLPMIEELSGKMLLNMVNQMLGGVPFDEMFIVDQLPSSR
ncbi:circadian clock-controlled protein daywake-like [Adelges cooleyi]|uniref:circadian clock-controlled protein daywake-like n=1 Tax=Adelges cooleyi TaxID=133065 RepID=UPI002180551E|nr:circadian clock-controlled protein daywake-like [Adelges cooleyi]